MDSKKGAKLGDTKSSTNFFNKGSNPNSGRNNPKDVKGTIAKPYQPPKPPTSL